MHNLPTNNKNEIFYLLQSYPRFMRRFVSVAQPLLGKIMYIRSSELISTNVLRGYINWYILIFYEEKSLNTDNSPKKSKVDSYRNRMKS